MTDSLQPPGRVLVQIASATMVSAMVLVAALATNQFAGAQSRHPRSARALPAGAQVIEHVIIIVQENRSTDNLFHDKKLIAEGADIASSGMNSEGQRIALEPVALSAGYDLDHSHHSFKAMYDGGKMDGANLIPVACGKVCPPNPQFKYVKVSNVVPYFQMAEQYSFADRMFQTNQGASFPAHQFLLAGTSAPTATSDLFAAEDVTGFLHANWDMGCAGPPQVLVRMIDPTGDESLEMFPCFEHPTLTDLLDNQSLTWRYYATAPNSIWTAPNSINHIRFGADWGNVIRPQTRILTDIDNRQLANVSWVTPSGQTSDHPWMNTGLGPSWVASIVNAVGNSPYWANTAIFVTWDDWGGWYDHVAPSSIYNSYEYGFRVPLIVVSQYAKRGYISHVNHDFGSILKFIEELYGLPSLGYADSRADDLSDCFNFDGTNSVFHTIAAPHDAAYFLNDRTPPTEADTD